MPKGDGKGNIELKAQRNLIGEFHQQGSNAIFVFERLQPWANIITFIFVREVAKSESGRLEYSCFAEKAVTSWLRN
jgi:hypothetical protein